MDIGYKTFSVCWEVVNGEENVSLVGRIGRVNQSKSNLVGRTPAVVVAFENDEKPALDETQYILEFSGAAVSRMQKSTRSLSGQFNLLKQCLIPENDPLLRSLGVRSCYARTHRWNKRLAATVASSGQVKIFDVLTNEETLQEVKSADDALVQLLRYYLQATKKEIWDCSGLTIEQVDELIATKTRIGLSATTAFGDAALDKLRYLLGKAGFPKETTILSEAKSAAIYCVLHHETAQTNALELSPGGGMKLRDKKFMVVDIGGGTTDIGVVQVLSTAPTLKLRDIQPVAACMSGSEELNHAAVNYVRQYFKNFWPAIETITDMQKKDLLRTVREQFEIVKKDFNPLKLQKDASELQIFPDPIHSALSPFLQSKGFDLHFTNKKIQQIFEDWLKDIVQLIRDERSQLETNGEKPGEIPIVLTGLGSSPEFIKQHIRTNTGAKVITINPSTCSSVVYGGYFSMLEKGLARRSLARFSYGFITPENSTVWLVEDYENPGRVYQSPSISDRAHSETPIWLIHKGEDLSGNNKFSCKGVMQIKEPIKFPLRIGIIIIKSADATIHERQLLALQDEIDTGTIIVEDEPLEMEMDQTRSGLRRETDKKSGRDIIETEFRVEIVFKGLHCEMQLLIPKFGTFTTKEWRDKKDLMTHEHQVDDLSSHTAQDNDSIETSTIQFLS